jgi:hypothetical protein
MGRTFSYDGADWRIPVLSALMMSADIDVTDSEQLQQPDAQNQDHKHIDDSLYGRRHGHVSIDEPKNNADDHQYQNEV